jgi:putative CocE/NonD family hydrolase
MPITLLALSTLPSVALNAQADLPYPSPAAKYEIRLQKSVRVPMRDGVRLYMDLHFPVASTKGKWPVVLIRTPYNKGRYRDAPSEAATFAGQGYVVAVQDTRGRFESEGEFRFEQHGHAGDSWDTVEWLARQSWSTGKIGTYGCSLLGSVQVHLAARRHPNHTTAIITGAGTSRTASTQAGAIPLTFAAGWMAGNGSTVFYRPPATVSDSLFAKIAEYFNPAGTIPSSNLQTAVRTLPIVDILEKVSPLPTDFSKWVSRDATDPGWRLVTASAADSFSVPTLHVNSWYDDEPDGTLDAFNLFRTNTSNPVARENQFLVMSPAMHCQSERLGKPSMVGQRNVGDARLDYYGLYVRWFDRWLKGVENDVTRMPKAQIYVMGRNQWRGESEWPLTRMRYSNWYLHSTGKANGRSGDGALSTATPLGKTGSDTYLYDPASPVPTSDVARIGDQSGIEMRSDVLVYTSDPLAQGIEVTGPIRVVLYVSSSARDTDFTAKLVDVHPDGRAFNIREGILRARYREGLDRQTWMETGQVYPITIDLSATSNYFRAGHRVRLEVSSSNFPAWDRNLNTGGKNYDESVGVVARNTVHHSARYPSHIVLPVVPDTAK